MKCVFALLLALTIVAPRSLPAASQAQGRRVVEISAERFEFWPSQVTIRQGEEVEFHIRSEDTAHGFRIVGTATSVTVPKRGKGAVVAVFRADKPGRFIFECSHMCGAGHNFMRGVLIVREAQSASGVP
jgi:heme/copper-type cytochrome/quinol oxidase subunit 2